MASIVMGARASTSYGVPLMVRGFHEYLYVWDTAIGEILPCSNEDANLHNPYTVAIENVLPKCNAKIHEENVFLNLYYSFKYSRFNFRGVQKSTKTVTFNSLENFRLYGMWYITF